MLRYASFIIPLLLRKNAPNPVKILSGYLGAFLFAFFSALFFLATIFTWVMKHYGLDIAFFTIALIFTLAALASGLIAHTRKVSETRQLKTREAEIKGFLAAKQDPLSDHIPDDILTHPMSQTILAQIEEKPWVASFAALGLGALISHQLIDAD